MKNEKIKIIIETEKEIETEIETIEEYYLEKTKDAFKNSDNIKINIEIIK